MTRLPDIPRRLRTSRSYELLLFLLEFYSRAHAIKYTFVDKMSRTLTARYFGNVPAINNRIRNEESPSVVAVYSSLYAIWHLPLTSTLARLLPTAATLYVHPKTTASLGAVVASARTRRNPKPIVLERRWFVAAATLSVTQTETRNHLIIRPSFKYFQDNYRTSNSMSNPLGEFYFAGSRGLLILRNRSDFLRWLSRDTRRGRSEISISDARGGVQGLRRCKMNDHWRNHLRVTFPIYVTIASALAAFLFICFLAGARAIRARGSATLPSLLSIASLGLVPGSQRGLSLFSLSPSVIIRLKNLIAFRYNAVSHSYSNRGLISIKRHRVPDLCHGKLYSAGPVCVERYQVSAAKR
ncbi:hypothetical protein PUN28_016038 [Cardiocondyla obscurior]|uniref:Uncharacterized protein n=1 Tax=Cardiocondyla obscurior TaxID=286306 RepID=A0AAW2ESD8_9HYME